MPQAVNEYIETNNFRKVDEIKRDILSLYEDDFMKIDPAGRLLLLFDSIPAGLNTNASRYQVSTVLFTTLMFKDKDFTENVIYEKLLSDKLRANLGYL